MARRTPAEPGTSPGTWLIRLLLLGVVGAAGALVVKGPEWFAAFTTPRGELDTKALLGEEETGPARSPELERWRASVPAGEEPARLLLARAWKARAGGDPASLDAALGFAEQAWARQPGDAAAAGLVAELWATRGAHPELRGAMLQAAQLAGADHPQVRAALAADAWVQDRVDRAAEHVRTCLQQDPTAWACMLWKLRIATPAAEPSATLAPWDELAAARPEMREVPRQAALLAARQGAKDARSRLELMVKLLPGDVELAVQLVRTYVTVGEDERAASLLVKLGKDAPPDLLVQLAEAALSEGDAARALRWLQRADPAALADPRDPERLGARRVQAMFLAQGPSPKLDAELKALGDQDVRVRQVRLLAALAEGSRAGARRAADSLDAGDLRGREAAFALLALAAVDVELGIPRDAERVLERAVASDPRLPELWLWRARVATASENEGALLAALERSVKAVDGAAARRNHMGQLLPVPCPPEKVLAGLAAIDHLRPLRPADRAFDTAAIHWLGGNAAAAEAALAPALGPDATLSALALKARLLLAKGDAAGALELAQRVSSRDPVAEWKLLEAQALAALRRDKEATAALKVVESGGDPGSVALLLDAEIALRAGDRAGAREAAEAARAADPDDRAVITFLEKLQ